MKDLEAYEKVNQSESLKELADIIREIGGEDKIIKGRTKNFNSENMAGYCERFEVLPCNLLTRSYGIRQQAMYLINRY